MRKIQASPQVEACIGAQAIQQLHEDPYALYTCRQCGRPGTTSEATSVIVVEYLDAYMVNLAHARCLDSQVLQVDADFPAGQDTDEFSDMNAKLAVLSYPAAPRFRSLLVLEPLVDTSVPSENGEQVSWWMSFLVRSGMALMSSGDQMPGRAEGWRLQFLDSGNAQLLDPGGIAIYVGECSPTSDWLDLASEINGCVVLIGKVGLYSVSDDDMTFDRFARMIDNAARRGALAGGLVAVEY